MVIHFTRYNCDIVSPLWNLQCMGRSQDDELLDHFPLDEAETRQEAASLLFSDSESDLDD